MGYGDQVMDSKLISPLLKSKPSPRNARAHGPLAKLDRKGGKAQNKIIMVYG